MKMSKEGKTSLAYIAAISVGVVLMAGAVLAFNTSDTADKRKFVNGNFTRTNERAFMSDTVPAYQIVDFSGTNILLRWEGSDTKAVFIKQITVVGITTTVRSVVGLWTNKDTLVFAPINQ